MSGKQELNKVGFSSEQELAQTIGQVSRAWREEMNQRLKPFGLNLSMRQVLMQLHRNPVGMMQRELARQLGIEDPTLVRLLNRLEEKQWLCRHCGTEDKRRKYVRLTEKAADQIRIIEKQTAALRVKMMERVATTDIEGCLAVMRQIKINLQPD